MKKTMIAAALAAAVGFAANAETQTWFNGGIATGWPTAETLNGGAWENTSFGTFSDGKLTVCTEDDGDYLAFNASVAKVVPTDTETVVFSSGVTFTPFEDAENLPDVPEGSKAGLVVAKDSETYYYYIYDGSTWSKTSTAVVDPSVEAAVEITATKNGEGIVNIAYSVGQTSLGSYDMSGTPSFQSVQFSGDGAVTSLSATYDQSVVFFTVNEVDHTSFVVSNNNEQLTQPYSAAPGSDVIVTYTALDGYLFDDGATVRSVTVPAADGTLDTGVTSDNVKAAAAKIDNKPYLTVAAALEAAQENDTVVLCHSSEEEGLTINEGVTLDLTAAYSIVTNGLANNGTILIYSVDQASSGLKDINGTLKAAVEIGSVAAGALYPAGTTIALTNVVFYPEGHTNIVPRSTITVGDGTLYWGYNINPYQQVTVNGDATFNGSVSAGWNSDLTSKLIVNGNLTIAKNVEIGNWAEMSVSGSVSQYAGTEKITLKDVNSKFTYAGDNITVDTDKAGYKVGKKGNVYAIATEVAVPTPEELTYNGTEQTGVAEGTGYTVTGNKGTDAGKYEATATLADGYVWSDGTTEAKSISWSIAQVSLTVKADDKEMVQNGTMPAFTYQVTSGSLVGEEKLTGTLTANTDGTETGTFDIVQSDDWVNANYDVTYEKGTLTVTAASSDPLPTVDPTDPDADTKATNNVATAFGADSSAAKNITNVGQYKAFNSFLGARGVTDTAAMTAAQKQYAYESFVLSEIMTTPTLLEAKPELKATSIALDGTTATMVVSLMAGEQEIALVRNELAKYVKVGDDPADVNDTATISESAGTTAITFTIDMSGYPEKGFTRVVIPTPTESN